MAALTSEAEAAAHADPVHRPTDARRVAEDARARVLAGADGQVVLILFSDEKTPGGASLRYASLSVEDGEMLLRIDTRDPVESEIHDVSAATLGVAILRAFAHVQPRMT